MFARGPRSHVCKDDGIEQGLRLLRDEDKGLKWTKKSQFASEIRNVYQQVAASVKGREFKVKKSPPRNVKAASFSPLPTTSLGARFMYINTTALLEINNAIIDINTSAQERARMSSTAQNKPHMFKQKSIIYQTPKTPGADNTEEASRFCNTRDQLWRSWFSPAAVCGVQMYKDVQDQPYKDVDQYHRRVFDYIIYTDLESVSWITVYPGRPFGNPQHPNPLLPGDYRFNRRYTRIVAVDPGICQIACYGRINRAFRILNSIYIMTNLIRL
ncbi:hypothetical protein SeLEV6574_g02133 [Synchytrium endobioticum]|uniref:Uncharacterized protein n=1 Tax=Synchytrium endobioticum TaxID=286115 RepID=A0A507D9X2_9FUNG|nr:hypothetical protein SeLEV6574_g02133 [Synchytrium endobioticum]